MSAHPQRAHRHAVRPMQPVARPGKVGGVPIYVALLRGVNVGGARPLKMSDLKNEFYSDLAKVKTALYTQGGKKAESTATT